MFSSYVPPPTGLAQNTSTSNGFVRSKSPGRGLNHSPSFEKKPVWGANDHSPKANGDLLGLRSDGTIESILNPRGLIVGKKKFNRRHFEDINGLGIAYEVIEK
jgi:hypothetical protein